MRFIGVDLAWTARGGTGVCAIEDNSLQASGRVGGDEELLRWTSGATQKQLSGPCELVARESGHQALKRDRPFPSFGRSASATPNVRCGFDEDGKPIDRAAAFFGRTKLASIEPRDVKAYLRSLAEAGLAPSSIRRLLAPLRAMFQDATEEGALRFNPASGVRVPATAKAREPKRKDLEPDELERLRGKLERDEDRLLVDFLVASGLRVSEVIALDWSDLDLGQHRVSVSKRNYRGDLDRPKSAMSRRDVRISQRMAQRLWELRKSRECVTDADPVFTTLTGKRHQYGNLYHRTLTPAMRAAGIEYGGFHRLRHSCGTQLRRRGASLEEVQLHLGHEDLSFTRRVYVHLDASDGPNPELLDDLAGCDGPEPEHTAAPIPLAAVS